MSLFTPDTSKLYVKRDVQGLIKALGHRKADVRLGAAVALADLGDSSAVEPLLGALADEDRSVRRSAAIALGKLGDPRAVEPLVAVLDEVDSFIRSSTVSALASINDASAVDALIAALDDESRAVGAAEALGQIGDPRAAEPLIAALADEQHPGRTGAAKALGQLGDPSVVDRLVAALADESMWVRSGAADGLAELGDHRAVEALIDVVSDDEHPGREYAAEALGRVDDPRAIRAIEPLIEMLGGDSPQAQKAADTLGNLGDSRAVDPLIAVLGSAGVRSDDRLLAAAATALGKLGDPRAIAPLTAREPPLGAMWNTHSGSAIRGAVGKLAIRSAEAEALAGQIGPWPPAPEGNCDVCNTPITQATSARVPHLEFKELVIRGYNPFESGRAREAERARYVGTDEEAYEGWKMVVLRDTTDWGLCAECAAELRAFKEGEAWAPSAEQAAAGLSAERIGGWIRACDVSNLARAFSSAFDWDDRETIMVGLRVLYGQHEGDSEVRDQLRAALPDLLSLCRAETTGGSYRDNCITVAESLLDKLGAPVEETREGVPLATTATAPASAPPSVPEDIAKLVDDALAIVAANVEVGGGVVHVSGAGSEGPIMPAVERFRTAHERHPELPGVHFAYCSALKIAAQNAAAHSELEALAAEHPHFALARWTLAAGERWQSLFALPEWGPASGALPAAISQRVIGCVLLAVRDGIDPRATLFFRDRGGDFASPDALRSARVEVAMVVDESSSTAPVVGIYVRVWDNPDSPMTMESHGLPLAPHGHAMRRAYEHLWSQQDLDFVVIANDDRVLLNRRLGVSGGMAEALTALGTVLDRDEEHEYEPAELRAAVSAHQAHYSAASVGY